MQGQKKTLLLHKIHLKLANFNNFIHFYWLFYWLIYILLILSILGKNRKTAVLVGKWHISWWLGCHVVQVQF
jgi:hypothetical protein